MNNIANKLFEQIILICENAGTKLSRPCGATHARQINWSPFLLISLQSIQNPFAIIKYRFMCFPTTLFFIASCLSLFPLDHKKLPHNIGCDFSSELALLRLPGVCYCRRIKIYLATLKFVIILYR